jgi:hypothetical protein
MPNQEKQNKAEEVGSISFDSQEIDIIHVQEGCESDFIRLPNGRWLECDSGAYNLVFSPVHDVLEHLLRSRNEDLSKKAGVR